jgi:hypothetical protein
MIPSKLMFVYRASLILGSTHRELVEMSALPEELVKFFSNGNTVCTPCKSNIRSMFTAKSRVHFPGLTNLDKAIVCVFPQLRNK